MFCKLRKIVEPEVASWLGAMAPVSAIASIGVSLAFSPWFSWRRNALSDLGISEVAPIFNSGLVVTGILLSVFAIALARVERKNSLGLTGSIGILSMGVSIVGVGVFTEAFLRVHILFAFSCFASLILSSILLGIRFTLDQETRALGVVALSSGALSIIVTTTYRPQGVAILETVIAFPFIPWYVALVLRLYRKSGAETSETKR
ncbi:MAG: DUF998 domain-containing protein [Candidatus Hodarchaeota archaeon]